MVDSDAPGISSPRPKRLRDYPTNSGHAAARLVGTALLANGRIKAVDLAALDAPTRSSCSRLIGGNGTK